MSYTWDNSASGSTTADFTMDTTSLNTIFATTYDNYTYNEWIDWLPYKWKKYIPTWHLVRSYK